MSQFLTISEFAKACGYSPGYIREKVEAGIIRGKRMGKAGHYRIDEREINRIFGEAEEPKYAPRTTEKKRRIQDEIQGIRNYVKERLRESKGMNRDE